MSSEKKENILKISYRGVSLQVPTDDQEGMILLRDLMEFFAQRYEPIHPSQDVLTKIHLSNIAPPVGKGRGKKKGS